MNSREVNGVLVFWSEWGEWDKAIYMNGNVRFFLSTNVLRSYQKTAVAGSELYFNYCEINKVVIVIQNLTMDGQFDDAPDDVTELPSSNQVDKAKESIEVSFLMWLLKEFNYPVDFVNFWNKFFFFFHFQLLTETELSQRLIDADLSDQYSDSGSEYNSDEFDYYDDQEGQYQKHSHSISTNQSHANAQSSSNKLSSFQPSDKLFKKYTHKINVDKYEMPQLPNHAINTLMENSKKLESERYRSKDKHDRATAEQGENVFLFDC